MAVNEIIGVGLALLCLIGIWMIGEKIIMYKPKRK